MTGARPVSLALLAVAASAAAVYAVAWGAMDGAFAAAIAVGLFGFGRVVDRMTRPLLLFGALQLAVGFYAAVAPPIFHHAIAGFLLGGTVPAVFRHAARSTGSMGSRLAQLTAAIALGGAAGLLIGGLWLIPAVGLRNAIGFAASVSELCGVIALVVGRHKSPPMDEEVPLAEAVANSEVAVADLATPHLGQALAGGVCLAITGLLLQIAWSRLLTIVLGSSAWAWTLIASAFAIALGLGALWTARQALGTDARRRFAWLQVALALAIAAGFPLYARLPHLFWSGHDLLARSRDTWVAYQAFSFACCLAVVFPVFFLGAAVPLCARLSLGHLDDAGRRFGASAAFALIGAVALPPFLRPVLPVEEAMVFAVLLSLLIPAVVLPRRWGPIALGVAAVVGFVAATAGWSHAVAKTGAFGETGRPWSSWAESMKASEVEVYADDTAVSAVVSHDAANPKNQVMRVNGEVTLSLEPGEREAPVLLGQLGPLLAAATVKQVLVLGGGSPAAIDSVLSHPIEHLDVVEPSFAVTTAGRGLVTQPDGRVTVIREPLRAWLDATPNRYGAVIDVPARPWVTTAAALFTQEHYRAVAAHLEPGGVFVQSLRFAESSEPVVQLWLRTLRDTFRACTTWGGDADLIAVCTVEPAAFDLPRLAARLADPKVAADLKTARLDNLAALLATQVHTTNGQAALAGTGPVNTVDQNQLEYGAAKAFFLRARKVEVGDQRRHAGPHGLFIEALTLTAEDAAAIYANLSAFYPKDDPLVRAAAERWYELAPAEPEARIASARLALAHGDLSVTRARLAADAPPVLAIETEKAWVTCCRTVWRDVDPPTAPPKPAAPEARKAWDSLCELAALEGCE